MAGRHKRFIVLKILALLLLCTYLMQKKCIKTTLFNFLFSNTSRQSNLKSKIQEQTLESRFVLSFSLFGDNWESYGSDVERVAVSAFESSFYHNWSIRLYHDGKMLNKHLMSSLKDKYSNLFFYDVRSLIEYGNVSFINGRTWRFLAAGDSKVDVMCSRDLDSPILSREEHAVREWLKSGKLFHVMRDNPVHTVLILGGTWCFRNKNNLSLGKKIAKLVVKNSRKRSNNKEALKQDDQNVLAKYVWPLIKNDVLQNDAYLCHIYEGSIAFPSKRTNPNVFVGIPYMELLWNNRSNLPACPLQCRPKNHRDWIYC